MMREEVENNYIKAFEEFNRNFDLNDQEVGDKAIAAFSRLGLPHRKVENWKYTSLHQYIPHRPRMDQYNSRPVREKIKEIDLNCRYQIILWNGEYYKEFSHLPEEINVENGKRSLDDDSDLIEVINASACSESLDIELSDNAHIDDPIHIIHYNDQNAKESILGPNLKLKIGINSKATILESFHSQNTSYLYSPLTTLHCEKNSNIEHIKIQREAGPSVHLGKLKATVMRDALLHTFVFSMSHGRTRNQVEVNLEEKGANTKVNGLFLTEEDQHCDNFSVINHKKEETISSQLYKGILDGKSHGIFTGKVFVQRDAQRIDSKQLNKNLLLSKSAHIDTRPQLEVYADDVKCAHGATTGQLSEDQLFYLQSRGIKKDIALNLLTHAFANEVLDFIVSKKARTALLQIFKDKYISKQTNEEIYHDF